ncbi:ATP-dependent RNA helicase [Venturia nashicola]|uniref:ATP-dependent RNA helicase n=1 Tax=Venturia nashicola TaxID=86259 RepID=A0A4Z1NYE2_9PEZI|nr:ATP-dependent RNA helicase [Venturia nashicola]
MAIFPGLPGFEAAVVVNGLVCAEHSPPDDMNDDEPKLVTTYIEATPGAKFAIHIWVRPETIALWNYDLCVWVRVDGQIVGKPLWRRKKGGRVKPRIVLGVEEKSGSSWTRRDLIFCNLNKGKMINKELREKVAKLGQITVEFFRCVIKRKKADLQGYGWNDGVDTVPEKALKGKALSHATSLSETATVVPAPCRYTSDHIDGRNDPYATICFQYRSLNDLKAEMIIPRSPSPIPLAERTPTTLEEALEVIRIQREQASNIQQENIRMKRERASSPPSIHEDNEDLSIIEPTPKRRRVTDTIDLTDD